MKRLLAFFLLACPGFALETAPWFPMLWEFQSRTTYFYNHDRQVQTPEGSFHSFNDNHSLILSLNATVWPYWNAEIELDLSHTQNVDFGYRAFYFGLRYQWMDDTAGDPFSLTSGVALSIPGNRFLHDFSFPYHGHVNGEFNSAIGKEFLFYRDWISRLWAYGGIGIADRGNAWAHTIMAWDLKTSLCTQIGIYCEGIFGFGSKNIIPGFSFEGYGPISHKNLDLGGYFNMQLGIFGDIGIGFWKQLYSQNFIKNRWGAGVSLSIPFSL